jgi:apolipoprotein N-acyltransferase
VAPPEARHDRYRSRAASPRRPHAVDTPSGGTLFFNSAFYITASGEIVARYDKSRLLPFGEYFPFPTLDLLRRRFGLVREFTAGRQVAPLDTPSGRIAVAICFEGIFPDLVREQMRSGARLLVSLSNDAWLRSAAGSEQHLAMARLRAIENRTWLVRATSTGISAIVDPYGRYRARSDADVEAILGGVVELVDHETLYERVGDFFPWLCLSVVSVASVWALAHGRFGPNALRKLSTPVATESTPGSRSRIRSGTPRRPRAYRRSSLRSRSDPRSR